jgi:hypothetical protein
MLSKRLASSGSWCRISSDPNMLSRYIHLRCTYVIKWKFMPAMMCEVLWINKKDFQTQSSGGRTLDYNNDRRDDVQNFKCTIMRIRKKRNT